MLLETADYTGAPDRLVERVAEAADLIGVSGLWSGQLLYTGVELEVSRHLDSEPRPASAHHSTRVTVAAPSIVAVSSSPS